MWCIFGNVYITVTIKKHDNFKIHGNDIILKKKINLVDALVSKTVIFKHLNGKHYNFEGDSIINPKTVKNIKGFGMPLKNSEGFGDMYIVFDIIFPKKIKKDRVEFVRKILIPYL